MQDSKGHKSFSEDAEFRGVHDYLYTGKLVGPAHCIHQGAVFMVQELAGLYVLASKLELEILMVLIVQELEKQDFRKSNPDLLFATAERIYPDMPESDRIFKDFFVAALTSCYENCEEFPKRTLKSSRSPGAPLALDIYQSQRAMDIELGAKIGGTTSLASAIAEKKLMRCSC